MIRKVSLLGILLGTLAPVLSGAAQEDLWSDPEGQGYQREVCRLLNMGYEGAGERSSAVCDDEGRPFVGSTVKMKRLALLLNCFALQKFVIDAWQKERLTPLEHIQLQLDARMLDFLLLSLSKDAPEPFDSFQKKFDEHRMETELPSSNDLRDFLKDRAPFFEQAISCYDDLVRFKADLQAWFHRSVLENSTLPADHHERVYDAAVSMLASCEQQRNREITRVLTKSTQSGNIAALMDTKELNRQLWLVEKASQSNHHAMVAWRWKPDLLAHDSKTELISIHSRRLMKKRLSEVNGDEFGLKDQVAATSSGSIPQDESASKSRIGSMPREEVGSRVPWKNKSTAASETDDSDDEEPLISLRAGHEERACAFLGLAFPDTQRAGRITRLRQYALLLNCLNLQERMVLAVVNAGRTDTVSQEVVYQARCDARAIYFLLGIITGERKIEPDHIPHELSKYVGSSEPLTWEQVFTIQGKELFFKPLVAMQQVLEMVPHDGKDIGEDAKCSVGNAAIACLAPKDEIKDRVGFLQGLSRAFRECKAQLSSAKCSPQQENLIKKAGVTYRVVGNPGQPLSTRFEQAQELNKDIDTLFTHAFFKDFETNPLPEQLGHNQDLSNSGKLSSPIIPSRTPERCSEGGGAASSLDESWMQSRKTARAPKGSVARRGKGSVAHRGKGSAAAKGSCQPNAELIAFSQTGDLIWQHRVDQQGNVHHTPYYAEVPSGTQKRADDRVRQEFAEEGRRRRKQRASEDSIVTLSHDGSSDKEYSASIPCPVAGENDEVEATPDALQDRASDFKENSFYDAPDVTVAERAREALAHMGSSLVPTSLIKTLVIDMENAIARV